MGILETKVKASNALVVSKKINKKWNWLFNYEHHYNGRVWVGWDPGVWYVTLHSSIDQVITCMATYLEKSITFTVSFVYAHNNACDRVPLWNYITHFNHSSTPWCLMWDFNCVLSLSEISGGREHWTPDMQSFKDCIVNSGLGTVRTVGDPFTWTNKRPQNPIFKHLDRMLGYAVWFQQFTQGSAQVRSWGLMDHNQIFFEEPMQINRVVKNVKIALRDLNKRNGDLHVDVHSLRAQLEDIQLALLTDNDSELLTQEKTIVDKLNIVLLREEHFLLQKSRKLMTNANSRCTSTTIDLSNIVCTTLNEAQSNALVEPIIDLIIFMTLKSMKHNKAPGPDGVNVEFFLATWETTGLSFCSAVKYFFETSLMSPEINSTFLSLIPKVITPTKMQDFRPISLCTVLYKCISKIIASRLKKVLPFIVDSAQSAFIPGRSISDNILLAQELFRGYDRETGSSRCALKIDLHKAFDTLKWEFILAVLNKIKVPNIMVSWIRACICAPQFSVKINGIVHGYFKGSVGVRQGDQCHLTFSPFV
ncbi:uncharacterized protein LOC141716183 [Apium graveolens]|uniref:uncharacterized protein LOC141716183 n=1 Tax=Apium graveolens TaxID=4045 RepID=UPI003D790CCD